jgi:hypothetical protein
MPKLYKPHIIAFLDILGFRDRIADSVGDPAEVQNIYDIMGHIRQNAETLLDISKKSKPVNLDKL